MVLVWLGTGRGFSSPSRMLLVGIAVSAMALSFVQYAIARAGREQATVVAAYVNGSLASRSMDDVVIVGVSLAVLLPGALLLSRRLRLLEMGDEQADALGARSGQTRLLAILLAIGLATAAVSVAGPIAFIALTAPQIARRISRMPGPGMLLSALMGAFLLAFADLLTQQSPFDVQLPVGILTAAVGGVYLGYLLVAEWKKGTV
jgi:iron complex transport system permease protein